MPCGPSAVAVAVAKLAGRSWSAAPVDALRYRPQEGPAVVDARELALGAAAGRLAEIARAALGEPGGVLGAWEAAAPGGASGGSGAPLSVHLLPGAARVGAEERPWSVVLKVVAPAAGQDDPAGINYWRREALLYGSGL